MQKVIEFVQTLARHLAVECSVGANVSHFDICVHGIHLEQANTETVWEYMLAFTSLCSYLNSPFHLHTCDGYYIQSTWQLWEPQYLWSMYEVFLERLNEYLYLSVSGFIPQAGFLSKRRKWAEPQQAIISTCFLAAEVCEGCPTCPQWQLPCHFGLYPHTERAYKSFFPSVVPVRCWDTVTRKWTMKMSHFKILEVKRHLGRRKLTTYMIQVSFVSGTKETFPKHPIILKAECVLNWLIVSQE